MQHAQMLQAGVHRQSQSPSLSACCQLGVNTWKFMQCGLTCDAQQVIGDDLPGRQLGVPAQHVNELADGARASQHSLILQVGEGIA